MMPNWDPEDDPMMQMPYVRRTPGEGKCRTFNVRQTRKARWTWQGVLTVLLLLAMMTLLAYDWGEAWLNAR